MVQCLRNPRARLVPVKKLPQILGIIKLEKKKKKMKKEKLALTSEATNLVPLSYRTS